MRGPLALWTSRDLWTLWDLWELHPSPSDGAETLAGTHAVVVADAAAAAATAGNADTATARRGGCGLRGWFGGVSAQQNFFASVRNVSWIGTL